MSDMEKFFKVIKENWMVLVFIVGLIISWTTFNVRLSRAEEDIVALKSAVTVINDLKVRIERIDTSVSFIKDRLK